MHSVCTGCQTGSPATSGGLSLLSAFSYVLLSHAFYFLMLSSSSYVLLSHAFYFLYFLLSLLSTLSTFYFLHLLLSLPSTFSTSYCLYFLLSPLSTVSSSTFSIRVVFSTFSVASILLGFVSIFYDLK